MKISYSTAQADLEFTMWSRAALNSAPECWNHGCEPPLMAEVQAEGGSALGRLEGNVEGYVHRVCAEVLPWF